MASSQNTPPTDSASTLRELVGSDPTATFEDDPTFVDANPAGTAYSENLGAAAPDDEDDVEDADVDDEDVDEDDLEDDEIDDEEAEDEDDLEDDDDEDEDDEDEDDDDVDDDDADEAGTTARLQPALQAAGLLDAEADDDTGDDGRENAVDEDALNADQEDDLDLDDPGLSPLEQETVRRREVGLLPATAADQVWL